MKKLPGSSIVLLENELRNQLGSIYCAWSFTALTALHRKSLVTGPPPAKLVPWGQKCIVHLWVRLATSEHLTFIRHWTQQSCPGIWRHESASAAFLGGWYVWNCLVFLLEPSSFSSCSEESPFNNATCRLPRADADAVILQDGPNFVWSWLFLNQSHWLSVQEW